MKFQSVVTFITFVVYLLLCSGVLVENLKTSMRKDRSSVRYVRSVESPKKAPKEGERQIDYKKLLETTRESG